MTSMRSIVVGIDFTPGCAAALREALRMAMWNRSVVRAVHVIDTLVAMELEEAVPGFPEKLREGLLADARRTWGEFSAGIDRAGSLAIEVRIDNRVRGILSAAREADADLLVLGANGGRGAGVGLGTVAGACVRHAAGNVLLVRATQAGPFKRVVACVDFSPTSLLALDQAAQVATQDGSALHVLHVFDPPWRQLHYRAPTPEADPHFQRQYREGLERRLGAFVSELGRGIAYLNPVVAVFDYHEHRSGIVEYAGRVGADLIVMGTRGRTNLRDLLLGSTAEKALDESRCSVLAVKPGGSGRS